MKITSELPKGIDLEKYGKHLVQNLNFDKFFKTLSEDDKYKFIGYLSNFISDELLIDSSKPNELESKVSDFCLKNRTYSRMLLEDVEFSNLSLENTQSSKEEVRRKNHNEVITSDNYILEKIHKFFTK